MRCEQKAEKPRTTLIDLQEFIDMLPMEQMKNAKTAAEELEFCDKFSKVKHLDNFAKMTVEIGKGFEQIALHLEDKMNKSNTNRKKKE